MRKGVRASLHVGRWLRLYAHVSSDYSSSVVTYTSSPPPPPPLPLLAETRGASDGYWKGTTCVIFSVMSPDVGRTCVVLLDGRT